MVGETIWWASVAAWATACIAGWLLVARELLPHLRRAAQSLSACGAWAELRPACKARLRRRAVALYAAGMGSVLAWPLVLWLTSPTLASVLGRTAGAAN